MFSYGGYNNIVPQNDCFSFWRFSTFYWLFIIGIAVSAFVGVVSGYWIFNPLLQEMAANRAERERLEAIEASKNNTSNSNGSSSGQQQQ